MIRHSDQKRLEAPIYEVVSATTDQLRRDGPTASMFFEEFQNFSKCFNELEHPLVSNAFKQWFISDTKDVLVADPDHPDAYSGRNYEVYFRKDLCGNLQIRPASWLDDPNDGPRMFKVSGRLHTSNYMFYDEIESFLEAIAAMLLDEGMAKFRFIQRIHSQLLCVVWDAKRGRFPTDVPNGVIEFSEFGAAEFFLNSTSRKQQVR